MPLPPLPSSPPVPLPPAPERFTFIATDGAQIGPDSHDVAYYYLINVGSMVYRHGSGQAPETASEPVVKSAVDPKDNRLLAGERIDAARDEVRDAMYKGSRLARAGRSEHENRAIGGRYGSDLLVVEFGLEVERLHKRDQSNA